MKELEYSYCIYPSLLDKFQQFLHSEELAENANNKVTEEMQERGMYTDRQVGDYITPPAMYAAVYETELINAINRCPYEVSEAADRGTCFNEVVDCLIHNTPCTRDDMQIRTIKDYGTPVCIEATLNGNQYYYDVKLCKDAAEYLKGSLSQIRLEAPMETKYGNILLYGIIDEWLKDEIIDIKTTARYDFGKFEDKTQRLVYPYCAIESGMTDNVASFTYLVFKWRKRKLILYEQKESQSFVDNTDSVVVDVAVPVDVYDAECYPEYYNYNHEIDSIHLQQVVERFIEWLNYRKEFITDKKIFGGENPEGYQGKINTKLLDEINNGK